MILQNYTIQNDQTMTNIILTSHGSSVVSACAALRDTLRCVASGSEFPLVPASTFTRHASQRISQRMWKRHCMYCYFLTACIKTFKLLRKWSVYSLLVASFDGPCAFLATLLISYFCCVLFKCCCYMENKLSLSYNSLIVLGQ